MKTIAARFMKRLARALLETLNLAFWILLAIELALAHGALIVHQFGPDVFLSGLGEAAWWGMVALSALICTAGYGIIDRKIGRIMP